MSWGSTKSNLSAPLRVTPSAFQSFGGHRNMRSHYTLAASLLVVSALVMPQAAMAQDSKPWSLGLKAGVSYDDNVTIQQLDVKSGIGDTIGNFEANAAYKLVDSQTNQLTLNYNFSQSLHKKLTNFDIQSHDIGFSGSTKVGGTTLGLSYSFYHLLLGGKRFLNMQVVSPSISGFIAPNVFLRGSYSYYDKQFHSVVARNASHHEPDITAFYFFNQSKSYVSLGGHYEIENTASPEFDYKGYALTAALQQPVAVGAREVKLNASYTYLHRNYNNITPSIGAKRYETRSTVAVSAEVPIVNRFSFIADYRYVDRQSNLSSANYKENVISGSLGYEF